MNKKTIKGFVIGATQSGSGKTTLTLAFLAALRNRGLKIASFKVGPDFIDPGHHARITGMPAGNLDGWMLSKSYNLESFHHLASLVDIIVVEGVMGLFDGYDGKTEAGSTAQMAKWLDLPVVLVVDARSMARSAAALVQGFERFDPDLDFAGVIFNHVGSPSHLNFLTDALGGNVSMPCLGGIFRNREIAIPERHLGLVTTEDHNLSEKMIGELAEIVETSIDLTGLLQRLPDVCIHQPEIKSTQNTKRKPVIGVARDNAFCFYYPDNIKLLEDAGADIEFFSPMKDTCIPENADALYFGGGYPEIYARELSENVSMRTIIRKQSEKGMPIYAECGGFMYLCEHISVIGGKVFPMCGCFPFSARMLLKLRSLGYREIELLEDTMIGKAGSILRGHEFHYSETDEDRHSCHSIYRVSDRSGIERRQEGFLIRNTLGSYFHIHFGSHPETAGVFVQSAREIRTE